MDLVKRYVLDSKGACTICQDKPSEQNTIKCHSCKLTFHGVCPSANDDNFICRQTFLKMWHGPSVKANFQWHCDSCLTKQEEHAVSYMEDRFERLISTVISLSDEVKTLKSGVNSEIQALKSAITPGSPIQATHTNTGSNVTNSSIWSDKTGLQKVKASLVIKNKPGDSTETDKSEELSKLKKVAIDNRIPVSRVGYDKDGNTYIDCPSVSDRNKLKPLLADDFVHKEVSVIKEKLPCISIVGIHDEVTKSNLVSQITRQNPSIEALINAGEEFHVLFVKSHDSGYTAVARVSPKIRSTIRSERNRIFLGVTCCRVYDRFHIKRCNHCQEFGHFKDGCTNPPCCAYCGKDHDSEQCGLKEESHDKHTCVNCKKAGLDGTGHTAFYYKCPSYIAAQDRLKSTMPYYKSSSRQQGLNT